MKLPKPKKYQSANVILKIYAVVVLLYLSIFAVFKAQSQCLNDLCETAITVTSETVVPFCNYECSQDFYDTEMNNDVVAWNETLGNYIEYECHQLHYDLWYRIEVDTPDSTICLNVLNGTCENELYPSAEGYAMMVYKGDYCDTAQLVWSTNCYWLDTNQNSWITDYEGIGDYDPTRQSWAVTLHGVENGTYYIQIDSFSWCQGCGEFSWCNGLNLLDLSIEEPTFDPVRNQLNKLHFDLLGRRR